MSIEDLVAFNLALVVAIASPGPALLVAIQTTLSSGRKAGIATGCGLGLMAATWTLLALFGLEAIFRLVPWVYTTTKAIGTIYLFYIAWSMWAGARENVVPTSMTARNSFVRGVMVNALNPKSVLFAGGRACRHLSKKLDDHRKRRNRVQPSCDRIHFLQYSGDLHG